MKEACVQNFSPEWPLGSELEVIKDHNFLRALQHSTACSFFWRIWTAKATIKMWWVLQSIYKSWECHDLLMTLDLWPNMTWPWVRFILHQTHFFRVSQLIPCHGMWTTNQYHFYHINPLFYLRTRGKKLKILGEAKNKMSIPISYLES